MLTTVVGNHPKIPNRPRPARLRAAIARLERGEIGEDELRRVEDEVTIEVIQEQADAGVDIITDGQIRWEDDQTYFARRLGGFSIDGLIRYFDTNTYYRQPVVTGPIQWRQPIAVEDYQFAAAHSPRPVKALVTGPYTLAALSANEHYGSFSELVLALAGELRHEVLALEKAGAPIIQVNEPAILKRKDDFPLLQRALERMMDGVRAETHLYTWFGDIDGLYPQILELPFSTIGLDFVMGAANYEVIKRAPFTSARGGFASGEKGLGLGIIDARNTRLETVEQIVERIRRVSDIVPPDRLYVNPSCGLEYLPREVAQAKLARMVEGVRRAQEALG
ncbi:MAG: methylcobamide--CoM methyltransferase [Chloroflexota bacterium]|nr:methylcobamide--CoM methyltransferase [Chloroflexota bacterium]